MKSKFKIIFMLFLEILALNLHGKSFSVGELSYTIINDSTVGVCGINGVEPKIVVMPETVSYELTNLQSLRKLSFMIVFCDLKKG